MACGPKGQHCALAKREGRHDIRAAVMTQAEAATAADGVIRPPSTICPQSLRHPSPPRLASRPPVMGSRQCKLFTCKQVCSISALAIRNWYGKQDVAWCARTLGWVFRIAYSVSRIAIRIRNTQYGTANLPSTRHVLPLIHDSQKPWVAGEARLVLCREMRGVRLSHARQCVPFRGFPHDQPETLLRARYERPSRGISRQTLIR